MNFCRPPAGGQQESSFLWAFPQCEFGQTRESGLGGVAGYSYFTHIRAQPPGAAPVNAGRMLSSVQATDRMPNRSTLS